MTLDKGGARVHLLERSDDRQILRIGNDGLEANDGNSLPAR
jgi:hypothetical protein